MKVIHKMDDTHIEKWLDDFNPENSDFDDLSDEEELEKLFGINADVLENNDFLKNMFDEIVSIFFLNL